MGYDADEPMWIGSLFCEHGLGHFFLAVTLPQARGPGYYRAMARHRIAAAPDVRGHADDPARSDCTDAR